MPRSPAFAERIQRKERGCCRYRQQPWPGTREHRHTNVTPQLASIVLPSLHPGQLLWALEPNGNWEMENSPLWAPCPQQGDGQVPHRGHSSLRNGKRLRTERREGISLFHRLQTGKCVRHHLFQKEMKFRRWFVNQWEYQACACPRGKKQHNVLLQSPSLNSCSSPQPRTPSPGTLNLTYLNTVLQYLQLKAMLLRWFSEVLMF